MSKLTVMRGYPGSGKTTKANAWVQEADNRVRLSRDDLRAMLYNDEGVLNLAKENFISKVMRDEAIAGLQKGFDVLIDATNLRLKYVREWAQLAEKWGAGFGVWDVYTPLEVCIKRDELRYLNGGRGVGEEVIRDMAQRFPYDFPAYTPASAPVAALEPAPAYDNHLPDAVLVDIDGTVALIPEGGRSPYDRTRVSEDIPNWPVIDLIRCFIDAHSAWHIIFVSGREGTEQCRTDTLKWLEGVGFIDRPLYMRPEGDMRNDAVIKYELYNKHIRGKFNVRYVVDDRNRVVEMWRSLGLTVLQVADGNF
jgi:predicted kinase